MGLFKRFRGSEDEKQEAGAAESRVETRHVTDGEFEAVVLQSEVPTVVDFWAEWCGPCHAIAPAVQQLADEYAGRVQVAKVNADDYPEILGRYAILGIPTLIYFKGGREVDRVVGFTGYHVLKSKAEKLLG